MTQRYYYLKSGAYGMDQFGRWTDNPIAWKVYTDRNEVFHMMKSYPQATVSRLR